MRQARRSGGCCLPSEAGSRLPAQSTWSWLTDELPAPWSAVLGGGSCGTSNIGSCERLWLAENDKLGRWHGDSSAACSCPGPG